MNRHRPLLLASGNTGKLDELRLLLADLPYRVLAPGDDNFTLTEVCEDGATFAANAGKKAAAAATGDALGRWALADDSGLEVEALAGAPGVHSARYAGASGTRQDAANIHRLLQEMKGVPGPRRAARFTCVLAVAHRDRILTLATGYVEGMISEAPAGQGGFGYDPVFFYPPAGRTFAQMSRREKAAVSHRGRALHHLRQFLTQAAAHEPLSS